MWWRNWQSLYVRIYYEFWFDFGICLISGSFRFLQIADSDLTDNVCRLLNYLVDEPTLTGLGWPLAGCEDVLSEVIQQCMYFFSAFFFCN